MQVARSPANDFWWIHLSFSERPVGAGRRESVTPPAPSDSIQRRKCASKSTSAPRSLKREALNRRDGNSLATAIALCADPDSTARAAALSAPIDAAQIPDTEVVS